MDEKPRICKRCGEQLFGNRKKKYCNTKCRTRDSSLRRYQKLKNNPEYIAYRKKYYAKWLENNRDKYNSKMREISKRWRAKKRDEVKAKEDGNV